jgi:hypothetical protein
VGSNPTGITIFNISVLLTENLLVFVEIDDLEIPGTDVVIFKIFSPENLAKQLAFLTQNKAKF